MAKTQTQSYKYVAIQSQINIRVCPKLLAQDVTKVNSDIKDRLAVRPSWPKASVMIYKGLGYYPNCIKDWSSVKAFIEKGLMSVAGETDQPGSLGKSDISEATAEKAVHQSLAIEKAIKEANAKLVEEKSPLEEAAE